MQMFTPDGQKTLFDYIEKGILCLLSVAITAGIPFLHKQGKELVAVLKNNRNGIVGDLTEHFDKKMAEQAETARVNDAKIQAALDQHAAEDREIEARNELWRQNTDRRIIELKTGNSNRLDSLAMSLNDLTDQIKGRLNSPATGD